MMRRYSCLSIYYLCLYTQSDMQRWHMHYKLVHLYRRIYWVGLKGVTKNNADYVQQPYAKQVLWNALHCPHKRAVFICVISTILSTVVFHYIHIVFLLLFLTTNLMCVRPVYSVNFLLSSFLIYGIEFNVIVFLVHLA